MQNNLSPRQLRDLRCVAAMMIPASAEFDVPGADDATIFGDITTSLLAPPGRDLADVRGILDNLAGLADLDVPSREAAATAFRARGGPALATLSRVILQCYYRDDRVVLSLGLEPRPPFPNGNIVEQGDWSLLDPVRGRPKMWRDAP